MKNTLCTLQYSAAPIHGGYTDRILHIDLTELKLSIQTMEPEFKNKYVGGRGYALKLIWDNLSKTTTYDSPENLLVMAGGPLCNEPKFPGAGKFIVGTISPLTGTFIDSNVGGYFAPILKACGFDALSVSGISSEKVIVVIDDDKGEIIIQKAPQTDDEAYQGGISYGEVLLHEYTDHQPHKNIAAVTTGIGAQTTLYGMINSHFYDSQRKRYRTKQAGRGGTGTVMRLKGLAGIIAHSSEARAKNNNPVYPEMVKHAGKALAKVIKNEDPKQLHLASWGTPVLVEYMNNFHLLPINNYQKGQDTKAKAVFSKVFLSEFLKKKRADGCYFGCNLACAKGAEEVTLTTGPFKGKTVGIDGPEYETVGAVTAMGIFDARFVMEYNWYCDEYGVDSISMGVSMAFLMECYQRGFLTSEETGYPLVWGDQAVASRLLHEAATGEGFGKICALGIHLAKQWVAESYANRSGESIEAALTEINKFAMESKGMEFSMYISRESLAQQGGYGFALKGPQHDEAWLIFLDQVHKELESYEKKTAALKWFPLIRTWFNAVGLCKLPWIDVRHPEAAGTDNPAQNMPSFNFYVDFFNGTTGSNKSLDEILHDSERLHLLQKLVNLRHGRGTRKDDQIPLRAMAPAFPEEYQDRESYYDSWLSNLKEPPVVLPDTIEKKHALLVEKRRQAYEQLCDAVYLAKGYNSEGIPTFETVGKFEILDSQASVLLTDYGVTPGLRN